ncbi:pyruvate dehydrogenase (acetyl-transferring) E1 component subunit alpha [Candidatus Fermentibacteria bacterium]|nr:pyruvate dehydrogenase (acetyl-transferring) E1 component subunit alpha [Candidatus Fermentibacteria bacterium]
MPRTTIYEAQTIRLQILMPDGSVDRSLMPTVDDGQILALYRGMATMRAVDEKALKLQRQGRMGTWAPLRGQEAAQAGVAHALEPEDWIVPAFREMGVLIMRGVPIHHIMTYWVGDSRGAVHPDFPRILPTAVPVGSQLLHGAGIGMAMELRDEPHAAVAFAGDGASSEGDFHEALNFAAVFKARTVFVIQNNQWAISVPFSKQTVVSSIAQKAHAYGLPGIQVDGNDVFAVYVAVKEALEQARAGRGPSLIEAFTYRMGDHTTADDASRYRTKEEVESWEAKSPIARLRLFMTAQGLWDQAQEENLRTEVEGLIEEEVRLMESRAPLEPGSMFQHMYADLPWNLKEQMESLQAEVAS